jgi:5-methyltetrahydropteroyltriglutamate--homocysteine methyltransferase
MADAIFHRLNAQLYLLEFDSPRAGSLDALGLIPEGKGVVLGLVTTKTAELEPLELLSARVGEAARHMPLAHLAISPQCGFSGDVRNRVMTSEQQTAKLQRVVHAARALWGEA